jgi:flagellar biosynthetic protein FliQ
MDEVMVVTIGREAIKTALALALPMLLAGMTSGILVSIFQVATSIQDMTITFIPKILSVFLVLTIAMHWMLRVLTNFMNEMMNLVQNVAG